MSLLANGAVGWIQIANFVVVGGMVIAAAIGARRALASQAGGRWGPILLGGYGVGLVAAGAFTADPAFGFPPGTPAGPQPMSWHGTAHLICAAIGFLALIAACFVFARRFATVVRRDWATYSVATGVAFGAGFVGIATGSGSVAATLVFTATVLIAWAWVTAISMHLYRHVAASGSAR